MTNRLRARPAHERLPRKLGGRLRPDGHVGFQRSLMKTGRGQIIDPLVADQTVKERPFIDQKAHAQAGHQHFGKGADVDDPSPGVDGLERRQGATLVAQVTDKLILQYRDIVTISQLYQLPATLDTHTGAGRIVKGGNGIEQPGVMLLEQLLHLLYLQATLVGRRAHNPETKSTEQIQRDRIGRTLDQDGVARPEKHLRHQRDCLLGTRSYQ